MTPLSVFLKIKTTVDLFSVKSYNLRMQTNTEPFHTYTAKFDPISKVYNIYHWTHIKHKIVYIKSKPTLEKVFVGDIIDIAKTESEVWQKLSILRKDTLSRC
jgi:hypothetical protein